MKKGIILLIVMSFMGCSVFKDYLKSLPSQSGEPTVV